MDGDLVGFVKDTLRFYIYIYYHTLSSTLPMDTQYNLAEIPDHIFSATESDLLWFIKDAIGSFAKREKREIVRLAPYKHESLTPEKCLRYYSLFSD